jgi:hypothetical protein
MANEPKQPEEDNLARLSARLRRNNQRLGASVDAVNALYSSYFAVALQFVAEFAQAGTDAAREAVINRVRDYAKQSIRQLAAHSKDVRVGVDEYAYIQPRLRLTPSSDREAVRSATIELRNVLTSWGLELDRRLWLLGAVRDLISIWPWQTDAMSVALVIDDCAVSLRDDTAYLKGVLVFLSEDLERFTGEAA